VIASAGWAAGALRAAAGATSSKDLGAQISLADYRGTWLIFFFTRWTLRSCARPKFWRCPTAEVLGASTDSVFSHFAWVSTPRDKNGIAGLAFRLVADFTKETARAYGVLALQRVLADEEAAA
jgi:peroxiredoxin (alkyl hydroperoxide reductase subunit C)